MKYFILLLLVIFSRCSNSKQNQQVQSRDIDSSTMLELIEFVLQEDTTQNMCVYNTLLDFSRENKIPEDYPDSIPPPPPPVNYIDIWEIKYDFNKYANYELNPIDSLHIIEQIDLVSKFRLDSLGLKHRVVDRVFLNRDSCDFEVAYVFYTPLIIVENKYALVEYDRILLGQYGLRFRSIFKSENGNWARIDKYIRWES